jgi:hypothetical protein
MISKKFFKILPSNVITFSFINDSHPTGETWEQIIKALSLALALSVTHKMAGKAS